jgi:hypothetical protein
MASNDYGGVTSFECSKTFHPEGNGGISLTYLDNKFQEHITVSTVDARTGQPIHLHFDTWNELATFNNVISQVIDKYMPKVKR